MRRSAPARRWRHQNRARPATKPLSRRCTAASRRTKCATAMSTTAPGNSASRCAATNAAASARVAKPRWVRHSTLDTMPRVAVVAHEPARLYSPHNARGAAILGAQREHVRLRAREEVADARHRVAAAKECAHLARRAVVAHHAVADRDALDAHHRAVVHQNRRAARKALARLRAAGAAGALLGGGARDRRDNERLHRRARIETLGFLEARVDHVDDAVDRQRRLGDVGGEHDLARAGRRRLKDFRLQVGRQRRVDARHDELADLRAERARAVRQNLGGRVDLVLAGEEDENVARRLRDVHLQRSDDDGVEVVGLGRLGVENVDRVAAAGNVENWRAVKVLAKLLGLERRRRDDELEVGSEARNVLDEAKENVGVQRALVRLVDH
jgi:hypothetical protein